MVSDISRDQAHDVRGFFSFDAVVAVIILLSMVSLASLMIRSIEDSANTLAIREKQARLLVLSDVLVRREFAAASNGNVYSNLLDLDIIQSIPSGSNLSEYLVSDISLDLTGPNGPLFSHKSIGVGAESYCIQRIVFVKGYSGPAILKVCGS
jgi:hypothetical protein